MSESQEAALAAPRPAAPLARAETQPADRRVRLHPPAAGLSSPPPCRGLLLTSCRSLPGGGGGGRGEGGASRRGRTGLGGAAAALREGGRDACSPGRGDSSGGAGRGVAGPLGTEAALAASRNARAHEPSPAGIFAPGEGKDRGGVVSWAPSPGRSASGSAGPAAGPLPAVGSARCWTASLCAPVLSCTEPTPGLAGDALGRGPESSRSVESRYPAAARVLGEGAAERVEGTCCPLTAEGQGDRAPTQEPHPPFCPLPSSLVHSGPVWVLTAPRTPRGAPGNFEGVCCGPAVFHKEFENIISLIRGIYKTNTRTEHKQTHKQRTNQWFPAGRG